MYEERRKGTLLAVLPAVLAGLLLAQAVPALASGDARVSWVPACRGGIEGQATDDEGRKVSFRVCTLPGGGFDARILDRAGQEMTRLTRTAEGNVVVRVGMVALGREEYTEEELAAIGRVLDSPDGRLAGRLPILLAEAGLPEDSPGARVLAAHGPLWERGDGRGPGQGMGPQGAGCLSPATGCHGCCGPACWGCTGICTPECLAHDECVELRGHMHPQCLQELEIAMVSMLECLDCDAHCTDGPADCCKGEGPACVEIP